MDILTNAAQVAVNFILSLSLWDVLDILVIAFLVSPVGLPMAAAWLLGKLQDLRYAIQDRVYG